jgi:hypothetical protein
MIIRSSSCLLLMMCWLFSSAQTRSVSQGIKFSHYLLGAGLYDDCSTVLQETLQISEITDQQKDSLNFNKGILYYRIDRDDSALASFSEISPNSVYFNESRVSESYILAHNGIYLESLAAIEEMNCKNIQDSSIRQLYRSGLFLLQRDTARFRQEKEMALVGVAEIRIAQKKINGLYNEIICQRKKSGILAGFLSAIVPGAGKVYSGKHYQGMSTFLPLAVMGAQAYEAYSIGGLQSARFIIYSGIFTVFYIANIWGSVLSVSVNRNEINKKINDQILFNLHIPIQKLLR